MSDLRLRRDLARVLRDSQEVQAGMDTIAEAALADAKAHVRVDTGELRDSLHLEDAPDGGRRLVAGTDHWLSEEFGTSEDPGQSFLRPVIANLGLKGH
jgi:hypothetical protein